MPILKDALDDAADALLEAQAHLRLRTLSGNRPDRKNPYWTQTENTLVKLRRLAHATDQALVAFRTFWDAMHKARIVELGE